MTEVDNPHFLKVKHHLLQFDKKTFLGAGPILCPIHGKCHKQNEQRSCVYVSIRDSPLGTEDLGHGAKVIYVKACYNFKPINQYQTPSGSERITEGMDSLYGLKDPIDKRTEQTKNICEG